MKKDISITMFEVVGSSLCVASGDGQKVYDRLSEALNEGCPVVLSFSQRDDIDSGFSEFRHRPVIWKIQRRTHPIPTQSGGYAAG